MKADAVYRRDTYSATDDITDLLEFIVERIVQVDDLLRVLVQNFSLPRQAEFLFAPLNEQGLEGALQRTDLLAYRRLRNFVNLRRFGKAFCLCQIAEDFQTLNLHLAYSLYYFMGSIVISGDLEFGQKPVLGTQTGQFRSLAVRTCFTLRNKS